MTKTWTTHEQKKLEELYKTGHTSRDISRHMHRSIHSVNKALCRFQLRKVCPKRPHRQLKISLSAQQQLPTNPDNRLLDNISGRRWRNTVAHNAITPTTIVHPHLLLRKLYASSSKPLKPKLSAPHTVSFIEAIQWLKQELKINVVKKRVGEHSTYQVNTGFGIMHKNLSTLQLKKFISQQREKMGMPLIDFHDII